ncbi:unnamed protein product [Vitrella brassicaformis CCMP3155]|uniref:Uncharacterized protein n=1 Tax=Vitrella brassicaformis (strain CCMP3155) TaxID=1169540 RepID=A0A0G4EY45_VITBC|nr:unnamed protein product [Vitrella brassicaformis CCMP3155]|eukprot:CEM03957.1 unnamed protein product [Vitrella brassicaformis CCMP3155]
MQMSYSLPLTPPRLTAIASHPVGNEILGFTIKAIKESGPLRLINRRDFHRQLVNRTFFQRWIDERHPAALRAFIVFDVRREANILFVAMCLVRDGGRWDIWPDYLSVLSAAREVTLPIRITDADVGVAARLNAPPCLAAQEDLWQSRQYSARVAAAALWPQRAAHHRPSG